jgi:signal transduction histidine kinase/FixJ family two-component response regulator
MNITDDLAPVKTLPSARLSDLGRRTPNRTKTLRVLVLDDNEDDFAYVKVLLNKSHSCRYEIDWAPTEAEALAALRRSRYDVGLFDYKLGGTTGLELLRALQQEQCEMPVILLTGSENPELDQAALDAGAADYLYKGALDTTRLERAIRYSCSHAQMLTALRESQAQLQLFMRSVPCAVCIHDDVGAVLFQNDIFKHHFSVAAVLAARPAGDANVGPTQYSSNGRHWLITTFPMVERTTRTLRGIAAIDITTRIEAEEALRKTETLIRQKSQLLGGLTMSLPVMVGRLDPKGVVLEAEGEKLAQYGLTPNALVGHRLADLYPQMKSAVAQSLRGGAVNSVMQARHNGREWFADFYLYSDHDNGKGALFFVCDISQRKVIERELLRVSDAEKSRIGSDLHDGLGQYLTGISCLSVALRDKLQAKQRALAEDASTISSLVQEAIAQTRALARGLCPVQLETSGLETALEDLTIQVQRVHGLQCTFEARGPVNACDMSVALHLYRITQEALNNAIKHASPRRIAVVADFTGENKILSIEDDGCGFDPNVEHGPSSGMSLMPYRASMFGGTLTVTSQPNAGTKVECRFVYPL